MSISVEDFLKESPIEPRKKSKLFAFKNEIRQLREAGATYAKITEFLKKNGVSVSWLTVRQFVINHLSEKQKAPLPSLEQGHKKALEALKAEKIVEKQTIENEESDENDEDSKTYSSRVENYVRPKWAKVDIKDLI